MLKLKAFFIFIFIVVLAAVGMVISADNAQIVSPSVFGLILPQTSLGIWLFICLLAGGILGFGIAWISWLKNVGQNRILARKLKSCEQELNQLRANALRE